MARATRGGRRMIKIVNPDKYSTCLSCHRSDTELLRTFEIRHTESFNNIVTLCTECLGELTKQAILYQPKEHK